MSMDETTPMLDAKEVAHRLGVSVKTIYRWANAGKLGTKVGPQFWRFMPSAVLAFQRGETQAVPRYPMRAKKGHVDGKET
jgi:excisionase family DNA binding protein